jgi:dipeptidyl aminopeptidase/acylaminoacyl peptidase
MFGQPSPLGISPNGKQVAFVLNRAAPASNSYCRALVVIDLNGPANPRILDQGGELITSIVTIRGIRSDNGFPALVTPVWSPDGRWISWLRRDNGLTQVWRARANGTRGEAVTRSATDITDVAWNEDGSRILFLTQPDLEAVRQKIAVEGESGWLYDDRFVPTDGLLPQLTGPMANRLFSVEPETGEIRAPTDSERKLWKTRETLRDAALPSAIAATGRKAWTGRARHTPFGPLNLVTDGKDGQPIRCESAACNGGFTGMWWDEAGQELRFMRREGWANGEMGFYRWTPGKGDPERLRLTSDVLHGCVPAAHDLICTSENSIAPKHVVRLDLATGEITPIFDPNPEFRAIQLGEVRRLFWKNDRGLEAWGDLVLPPGYDGRSRLPLIVVQYTSLGFLRGGTGDEYPIYPLAAEGFAVLSLQQPDLVAKTLPGIKSVEQLIAAGNKDWAERRSLLSSLETGVDKAIAAGVADPARIGLTGLSNGATTVRFALINSDRFAAASISSCCLDPQTVAIYTGPAFARQMRSVGFPEHGDDAPEFWQPFSMARNAERMKRPLLMQLADSESLVALETFTALKSAGQPAEMFVFPRELHVKWQPVHRRAIYQRNIDWFRFWLQQRIDPDPAKADQYRRWTAMRVGAGEPSSPFP